MEVHCKIDLVRLPSGSLLTNQFFSLHGHMPMFTNNHNIPLSLAVWLAVDEYDHKDDPKIISATKLLKPLKQIILASRVSPTAQPAELADQVASRMGTAIHNSIEMSWIKHYKSALTKLGYPQRVIDAIKVNPEPHEVDEDTIAVYTERRVTKPLGYGDWQISGELDFCAEGRVRDFKSTSVFAYLNDNKDEDYIMQGSIYRWLQPDVVTEELMNIDYIFTDWSKKDSLANPHYPKTKVATREFRLKPVHEIQQFAINKVRQIEELWDKPEEDMPECTPKELWQSETVWKYYSKPDAKRASKNFTNKLEADMHLGEKGKGHIKEVKGEVKACKYCDAFAVCKQKDRLYAEGKLKF